MSDPAVSEIVIAGGVAYAGLVEGVAALPLSGAFTPAWTVASSADVDHVAVGGDTIAFAVLGAGIGIVDSAGNPVAESGSDEVLRALTIADGLVVGAGSDAGLIAWDAGTAAQQWSVDGSGGNVWGLEADGDTLYFASGGVLEGVATADGSQLFSASSSGDVVAIHPL